MAISPIFAVAEQPRKKRVQVRLSEADRTPKPAAVEAGHGAKSILTSTSKSPLVEARSKGIWSLSAQESAFGPPVSRIAVELRATLTLLYVDPP